MTKALIIEFLTVSWLEHHLARHHEDEEKLDSSLLIQSFAGLRAVQSNWTMITRGLIAGEPEFEDPEIQAGLLEYLNQVELPVDQTEWRRLFNEVRFSTSTGVRRQQATPTPRVVQGSGVPEEPAAALGKPRRQQAMFRRMRRQQLLQLLHHRWLRLLRSPKRNYPLKKI